MGKLYIDDNREVWCNGTFGDAYMMCLKMTGNDIKKINFHTRNQNLIPTIKDIMSLLGDIPFEYIGYKILNRHKRCVGFIDKGESATPFPKWELPNVSNFNLPSEYQVIQLQSGVNISKTPWRKIGHNVVNHLLNFPIVLLGTDNMDISFLKRDTIDLRGKTNILESLSILRDAKHFYGPQGLLTFFALSQKVKSTIWVKGKSDVTAVKSRIGKIPEWKKFYKKITTK